MLPYLRPLSPNNPESAIPKTRERNNLYARESTYHDYDLQEAEHAETGHPRRSCISPERNSTRSIIAQMTT
jgi:hypothetical protein